MVRLTARNEYEKRTRFEAAPAASIAGDVGRLVMLYSIKQISAYSIGIFCCTVSNSCLVTYDGSVPYNPSYTAKNTSNIPRTYKQFCIT